MVYPFPWYTIMQRGADSRVRGRSRGTPAHHWRRLNTGATLYLGDPTPVPISQDYTRISLGGHHLLLPGQQMPAKTRCQPHKDDESDGRRPIACLRLQHTPRPTGFARTAERSCIQQTKRLGCEAGLIGRADRGPE